MNTQYTSISNSSQGCTEDTHNALDRLAGPRALPIGEDSIIPPKQISLQTDTVHFSFSVKQDVSLASTSLTLCVTARNGCGGVTWPAGEVLANYLVNRSVSIKGRNIVELGSGTGLVGLLAAQLGGRVWITDQAPMLDIMQRNVSLNHLDSVVTVAQLDWGTKISSDIPRPSLILAADCVYFEPAFPLLVQTLADLTDTETEILFCYKKRRKADKRFFTLLKKEFTWSAIIDDPNCDKYSREAISLLRLRKHQR